MSISSLSDLPTSASTAMRLLRRGKSEGHEVKVCTTTREPHARPTVTESQPRDSRQTVESRRIEQEGPGLCASKLGRCSVDAPDRLPLAAGHDRLDGDASASKMAIGSGRPGLVRSSADDQCYANLARTCRLAAFSRATVPWMHGGSEGRGSDKLLANLWAETSLSRRTSADRMLSCRRPRGLCAGVAALLLSSTAVVVQAKTVVYDFNVTWVTADPTGRFERPVIGINGQWPIPTMECNVGDALIVNVHNQLGNQTTAMHFHGMFQNGTSHMDGAVGVTQCPIPPGSSMKYNFTANQPGTYWYHSHVRGQYPDGLRGAFIVHDPDSPYKDDYDEELVLTVSDWYNEQMTPLIEAFLHVTNPTGAEPVPDAALLNDTQNLKVAVEPGKTYLFRIINVGALASQYVWFEGHTMKVVEVDGVYTDAADADMIYLTPAQRYGVLVTAKDNADANFAFVGSMDQDMFDQVPPGLDPNVTGWLAYDEQKEFPAAALIDEFAPFDDFTLVPVDKEEILEHVDFSVTLDMKMDNLGDGINYAFFNDITYLRPKVPTLYSALTTGSSAADPAIYGVNTHPYILKKGDVVEIILNNDDPGKHPFHLHGHNFQTVVRSEEEVGAYDATNITVPMPRTPMRRDTLLVRPNSNFAIRFRADNPGVWLFHCHVEWHMVSGLAMTFIEAPEDIPRTHNIPEDHLQLCEGQGIATAGNAVGNQDDLFDLTGANVSPPPLPEGFTPRGIVALTFSIVSALIGVAVISWYGMAEIKTAGGGATLASKAAN